MTQYHFLDESGDPGLDGQASSSSHFALAMVQLPERAPLAELARVRRALHLRPNFEFKYHKTTSEQKRVFFQAARSLSYHVRAVVIDKYESQGQFVGMSGQDRTSTLIVDLAMRAFELDIADDVLVIDGATRAFLRTLRVGLSKKCRRLDRVRPFGTIVGGDSRREDGLQLADMVAGAVRQYVMGIEASYYQSFANKVTDLWKVPEKKQ